MGYFNSLFSSNNFTLSEFFIKSLVTHKIEVICNALESCQAMFGGGWLDNLIDLDVLNPLSKLGHECFLDHIIGDLHALKAFLGLSLMAIM